MIDLHVHLLPGVDDGAADDDEALALAAALADDGVTLAAATPHLRRRAPSAAVGELADRVARLRELVGGAGVPLEVLAGGEADLLWALDAADEDLARASFGQRGTDLLLETPYGALPTAFDALALRIAERGFRILLAHPERNGTYQRDPARLRGLVDAGVLVQVTAGALTGESRRSAARRTAEALVTEGLAHVLASDRHGAAVRRGSLGAGVDAARRLVGAYADWMVTDAPAAIVAGEPLPDPPGPSGPPPRRWLGRRR